MTQLQLSNIFLCGGKLSFLLSSFSMLLNLNINESVKQSAVQMFLLFHRPKISDFGLCGCLSIVFDGTKLMQSPDYRVTMCSTFSVSLCNFVFLNSITGQLC